MNWLNVKKKLIYKQIKDINYKSYGHEPLGFERRVAIQWERKRTNLFSYKKRLSKEGETKNQLYIVKVDGSLGFIKGIGIQRRGNKWIWK